MKLVNRHLDDLAILPSLFVDIGCGEGNDSFMIRKLCRNATISGRFIGLDGNPSSIAMCNLRSDYHQSDDSEFLINDFTKEIPISTDSVALVLCSEVLEHLPDPELLIKEFHRILSRDGLLLITTPNEPNVLQRPFWSAAARSKLAEQIQGLVDHPTTVDSCDGMKAVLYGHISCKTNQMWDTLIENSGY